MSEAEPVASTPDDTKPVVGMIHVGALPGTPGHRQTLDELVEDACAEARLYRDVGVNCLMLDRKSVV